MEKINRLALRASVVIASATALLIAGATNAFATGTDPVNDAFTSSQSQLTGYITTGVAVIVAVLGVGLGVGLLVKYLRKAVRAA